MSQLESHICANCVFFKPENVSKLDPESAKRLDNLANIYGHCDIEKTGKFSVEECDVLDENGKIAFSPIVLI